MTHEASYSCIVSLDKKCYLGDESVPQMKMARNPADNPFSLCSSVNLSATLCRKRAVSQRNTEAAQGTTEKKPRVELIGRISSKQSWEAGNRPNIYSGTRISLDMGLTTLSSLWVISM